MTSSFAGFYLCYKSHKENALEYRSAKAAAFNAVYALEHNQDANNTLLVNHLTTILETSLLGVIHHHLENKNLVDKYEKNQVIKLVEKIDLLVANNKLNFLSSEHASDEFNSYLKSGIAKIKEAD